MRVQALLAAPLVAALVAGCPSTSSSKSQESRGPEGDEASGEAGAPETGPAPTFTLLATTELRGQIEPCGCTSDPHGDIARIADLVSDARDEGEVLLLDGGSTLYSQQNVTKEAEAQETAKAAFVARMLGNQLRAGAVGLGPYDLARGAGEVRPPRHAVNVVKEQGLRLVPPAIARVGGTKVGIFGVTSPDALSGFNLEAKPPAGPAGEAVKTLEGRGARVVVALAHMTVREARELAGEVDGIDFILVGQKAPEPPRVQSAPERVGDTWLFQPANRGQVVARLRIGVRGDGAFADAIGRDRAEIERAALAERADELRDDLAEWSQDPDADPEFVAGKKKELRELESEQEQLAARPVRVPEEGNWFTLAQLPITKGLDCDGGVQKRKVALSERIGKANLEALADKKPPEPKAGEPSYAGTEECGFCHAEAVEFWKTTKHAQAWETLAGLGKQHDLECVSCHVTGYDEPGGSTLAHNEGLRDVQCEVCHGPGSLHVAANGKESPSTLTLAPPRDRCVTCHNPQHSDTFEYEAYLRDVTGKGHGGAFRDKLGDGVTGHELRQQALAEAGNEVGDKCAK